MKTRKTQSRRSQQRMVSRLRRRYTRVVKIGGKWNTYLQIDHQGFCVVEQTCRQRAQWFGKMLAVALERMLAANAGAVPRRGSDVGTSPLLGLPGSGD